MDKETLGAVIGLLLTLAGIIKILMGAYFKMADKHEAVKDAFATKQIDELKSIVNNLSATVEQFKKKIDSQIEQTSNLHTSFGGVSAALKAYVEVNTKEKDLIKSQIIQITKDLMIIKGRK